MNRVSVALTLLVPVLSAARLYGQHPNFSGSWVLDRAHSSLEYPQVAQLDSGFLLIEHSGSRFAFFRRSVVAGQHDTLSWTLTPDGPEDTSSEGARRSFSRLRWSGATLVLEVRIETPRGEAGDTVRYRLLEGGRVLEAQERFRAPRLRYDNRWVFARR